MDVCLRGTDISMKKWKRLTIKTKIMILYSVLSAILLIILIPTIYMLVINTFEENLRSDMESSANNVWGCLYEKDGTVYIDEESITPDIVKSGVYVQVYIETEQGAETVYLSADMDWALEVTGSMSEKELKKEWDSFKNEYLVGDQEVCIYVLGNIYFNSFIEDMFWILVLLGIVFLLISVLGSRFIVSRALRPVKMITQTAAGVSLNNPQQRIDGIESRDEVGELAKTFNVMLDNLEDAFERERQFTSDVSHELRTPLTVIETCADDALSTDNPEIIRENLNTIKKENERMTKMISQLLFLSRGYEGRIRFEPEEFILWDLVQSVVEVSFIKAQEKNIKIHNNVPEGLVIFADQSLFIQLFVNLVDNAVKYGHEDGNIWIEAFECEGFIRIIVRDDGIGISEGDIDHIFDRFYRADRARDRSGQGLGLSIVKWIVELHGGEIFAVSNAEKGTTFCMEI